MMWPAGGHTVPSHHFPDYITAVTKFLTRVNLQPSFSKRKSFTDRRTVYPQPFQGITVIWRENNLKARRIWRENKCSSVQRQSHTVRPQQHSSQSAGQRIILCDHFHLFSFLITFYLSQAPLFSFRTAPLKIIVQGPKSGLSLTSCVAFISYPSHSVPCFQLTPQHYAEWGMFAKITAPVYSEYLDVVFKRQHLCKKTCDSVFPSKQRFLSKQRKSQAHCVWHFHIIIVILSFTNNSLQTICFYDFLDVTLLCEDDSSYSNKMPPNATLFYWSCFSFTVYFLCEHL